MTAPSPRSHAALAVFTVTVTVAVAGLATAITGCEPQSERCDRDQRYWYGLCYDVDAAIDADSRYVHFGDVCSDATGCVDPTDFCVRLPGAASGYCTRTGCLSDATVCPAAWSCVDLSTIQPGLPAICAKP